VAAARLITRHAGHDTPGAAAAGLADNRKAVGIRRWGVAGVASADILR